MSDSATTDEMTMIDDEDPPELHERALPGHPVAAHHGEGAHHAAAPRP